MRNSQAWENQLTECLQKAANFYSPRAWSEDHNRIWIKTLGRFPANHIHEAFEFFYETGKHMPKPAEIIEIIKRFHPPKTDREKNDERVEEERRETGGDGTDPIVASAWYRFNKIQNGVNLRFEEKKSRPARVQMTDEQAIMICNYEARRLDMPYAIKQTFWIKGVWGFDKPKNRLEIEKKKRGFKPQPMPDYRSFLEDRAA